MCVFQYKCPHNELYSTEIFSIPVCVSTVSVGDKFCNVFESRFFECFIWYFGILLGSPLAVAKAAATLPGVHTTHDTQHNTEH